MRWSRRSHCRPHKTPHQHLLHRVGYNNTHNLGRRRQAGSSRLRNSVLGRMIGFLSDSEATIEAAPPPLVGPRSTTSPTPSVFDKTARKHALLGSLAPSYKRPVFLVFWSSALVDEYDSCAPARGPPKPLNRDLASRISCRDASGHFV